MGLVDKGAVAQRKMDTYKKRGDQARKERALQAADIRSFRGQLLSAAIDICLSYDGVVAEDDDGLILAWPVEVPDGPGDVLVGLLVRAREAGSFRLDIICSTETDYSFSDEEKKAATKEVQPEIRRMMRFFSEMGKAPTA